MKKRLIGILGILKKSYARFSISKFQSFQQLVSKVMFRILLSIIPSIMETIYIYINGNTCTEINLIETIEVNGETVNWDCWKEILGKIKYKET